MKIILITSLLFTQALYSGQPGGFRARNNSCSYLKKCDSNNTCTDKSDECYSIGECDEPVCLEQSQACLKECGTSKCSIAESLPLQPICNN